MNIATSPARPETANVAHDRDGKSELPYMLQLDSLRAFAIGGVLLAHLYGLRHLPFRLGRIDWAGLGVSLFFVLSGYLITNILLRYRAAAEVAGHGKHSYVRRFYIRRALRIFPLYYLVLFVTFALNVQAVRETILWLLTYTTNYYIATRWNWVGPMGHFWTLAVEEQFYLVWPWILMFLPRRWLVPAAIACIVAAPAYRAYAAAMYPEDVLFGPLYTYTHTFAQLDRLGSGALLAIALHSSRSIERVHRILRRWIFPAGAIAAIVLHVMMVYDISRLSRLIFFPVAVSAVFASVIAAASRGIGGPVGSLLNLRPLAYVGKISYGVYVYHNFMPLLAVTYELHPGRRSVMFVLSSLATLVVAAISWHLIEKPLNQLKDRVTLDAIPSSPATSRTEVAHV